MFLPPFAAMLKLVPNEYSRAENKTDVCIEGTMYIELFLLVFVHEKSTRRAFAARE